MLLEVQLEAAVESQVSWSQVLSESALVERPILAAFCLEVVVVIILHLL